MGRFARSWDLAKTSLSVVKQDKELLWMPVLSGLATLVAIASIAGVGVFSGAWTANDDGSSNPAGIALAFAMYVALAFITLYFNAAVIAGANERLAGGDPTVGSALRAANRRIGKLFLWSLVVATVNVILRAIRERAGIVGSILSSIAGVAWNLATFFVVPVLVLDDQGVGASVKRSGQLFRQTWGEAAIGQGGIGLVSFLVGFAIVLTGALASVAALLTLGWVAFAVVAGLFVLALLAAIAFFSVLDGVYKAALYRFATTRQLANGWTEVQLGGAFTPR